MDGLFGSGLLSLSFIGELVSLKLIKGKQMKIQTTTKLSDLPNGVPVTITVKYNCKVSENTSPGDHDGDLPKAHDKVTDGKTTRCIKNVVNITTIKKFANVTVILGA